MTRRGDRRSRDGCGGRRLSRSRFRRRALRVRARRRRARGPALARRRRARGRAGRIRRTGGRLCRAAKRKGRRTRREANVENKGLRRGTRDAPGAEVLRDDRVGASGEFLQIEAVDDRGPRPRVAVAIDHTEHREAQLGWRRSRRRRRRDRGFCGGAHSDLIMQRWRIRPARRWRRRRARQG
jgi:hypothetical protein